ncbi:MAG: Do family serine endopeptidase [Rhizobiales bacterium]|nr:Do family serine endopeptidase [Hyphomicrobiales bacterium]
MTIWLRLFAVSFFVLNLLAFGGLAEAQNKVPSSRAEIGLSFAPVVKETAPGVVNIYTRKIVRNRRFMPFADDPIFKHFFGRGEMQRENTRPRKRVQNSLGSGVIVGASGIVVTNEHVIQGGDDIIVVLSDKREVEAEVMLRDRRTDLAVLRINLKGERLKALKLRDSDTLAVGDLVLAIGNPFGVGQTVTSGIISALGRTKVSRQADYQFFIQTDAAINPGNSGGALVDMNGDLVGINTAIFSRSGGSHGIGFAIPANIVRNVIDNAIAGREKVRRPWAGASLQDVTTDIAESLGFSRPRGALVRVLHEKSPLRKAGIRVGDLLLEIGKRRVENSKEFASRFANLPAGGSIRVLYQRGGRAKAVVVPLQPPPEDPPRNLTLIKGYGPMSGSMVGNLSPALADEMRLDPREVGVIVTEVKGGRAREIGFRRGDIVMEVNGQKIARVRDLEKVVRRAPDLWRMVMKRNGRIIRSNLQSY